MGGKKATLEEAYRLFKNNDESNSDTEAPKNAPKTSSGTATAPLNNSREMGKEQTSQKTAAKIETQLAFEKWFSSFKHKVENFAHNLGFSSVEKNHLLAGAMAAQKPLSTIDDNSLKSQAEKVGGAEIAQVLERAKELGKNLITSISGGHEFTLATGVNFSSQNIGNRNQNFTLAV